MHKNTNKAVEYTKKKKKITEQDLSLIYMFHDKTWSNTMQTEKLFCVGLLEHLHLNSLNSFGCNTDFKDVQLTNNQVLVGFGFL